MECSIAIIYSIFAEEVMGDTSGHNAKWKREHIILVVDPVLFSNYRNISRFVNSLKT